QPRRPLADEAGTLRLLERPLDLPEGLAVAEEAQAASLGGALEDLVVVGGVEADHRPDRARRRRRHAVDGVDEAARRHRPAAELGAVDDLSRCRDPRVRLFGVALFDAYLFIDWSARSGLSPRTPSPDSVWIGEVAPLIAPVEKYFRGRLEATAHVRAR